MFSASHTLEYAYSAWAVAQWAKQLGKTDDYNRLMDLSKAGSVSMTLPVILSVLKEGWYVYRGLQSDASMARIPRR